MKKIAAFLICLSLTPAVYAGKGMNKGKNKGGKDGIFKQLDLSEDQRKELKEIRSSRKDKMKSLREEKRNSREAFQQAMESGSSDSKLKSLHSKMLSAEESFKSYKFETMLKTRGILTSSQKSKFNELKSQMRKKWQKK